MDRNKIISASNIMLGNNQVKSIYLGNNILWEQNPQRKTLTLMPIVLDSNRNLVLSYKNSLPTQGNSTFIMKVLNDINISDIDIEYPYESFNSNLIPRVIFQKLDNYALYCNRFGTFNAWKGGSSDGLYDENVTFKYNDQLGVQSKSINFYGNGDEDNQMFLDGLYVNKVIKSPSIGRSGIVKIKFYPYSFDDEFYSMKEFRLSLVDYENIPNTKNLYLWDFNEHVFRNESNNTIKTLDDTIFSTFNVTYQNLEGIIEYTIKPNYSNEFKEAVLSVRDCMIHFIQEPHNDNRIYILEWHTRAFNFTNGDSYLDNGDTSENMFQLSGSKIIERDITINFTIWTDLLIPESLENEYNIEFEGNTKLNNNKFYWDNISYKFYTCYKDSKIIFKKK